MSQVNLFERLFDQYEFHRTTTKSIGSRLSLSDDKLSRSAIERTQFTPPNSGHVAHILRCLRDHASIFDNYSSIFQLTHVDGMHDESTSIDKRWQTIVDCLNDDEKKWSAMHLHERQQNDTFRMNSTNTSIGQNANFNENNNDANQRRQTFHTRSFGSSAAPYVDDDDDVSRSFVRLNIEQRQRHV
jgi:hypothetical protein